MLIKYFFITKKNNKIRLIIIKVIKLFKYKKLNKDY